MSLLNKSDLLNEYELSELAKIMSTKYAAFLQGRTISISTRLEDAGIWVQVLLKNSDDSFHYPIEGRMLYEEEEMTAREGSLFLIDYIDLYLEEYLGEDDNLFIPIDWARYHYDAVNFEMRGQVLNLKAEAMADALLKSNDESLS